MNDHKYLYRYKIPRNLFDEFKNEVYQEPHLVNEEQSSEPGHTRNQLTRVKSSMMFKSNVNSTVNLHPEVHSEPDNIRSSNNSSIMYAFKIYLRDEFEKMLTQRSDQNVQISHIHLEFDHKDIYSMLEERGQFIKDGDHDLSDEIETSIIEYIEQNNSQVTTPKEVFITFETEESMNLALEYIKNKESRREWNGKKLKFKIADEPSNIEYFNKYQSKPYLMVKKVIVLFALFGFLAFICYIIFSFMDNVNMLNRIFPQVNCEDVLNESNEEMLDNYAMIEYHNYKTSNKTDESMMQINTDNLQ
jgi:hypothetical protein